MVTWYSTLKAEYGSCPPDCLACEQACAKEKSKGAVGEARIQAVHAPEGNYHGVSVCGQCSVSACKEVCPTGAISKSESDGVVRVAEEKCVGCGLCTLVCPYGGVYFSTERAKAFKCDLCDGKPKCVEACPHGVLSFFQPQSVLEYFRSEDAVVPGTTLCAGCMTDLAARIATRVLGKDAIFFGAPGCSGQPIMECSLANHLTLLSNAAATADGVSKYYHKIGRDVRVVAFIGDGATADCGFQSLSGAAERGANIIYICSDNEGYMNTGIQRSGTTPRRAWTFTTPVGVARRGKEQASKYMPLLMAFHNAAYVATATPAYLEDYVRKLARAGEVRDGLSYIHILVPCPTGWRASPAEAVGISQMAVKTNYFPLWEADHGKFIFTYPVDRPRPLIDYLKMMGRFSHLTPGELQQIQGDIDARIEILELLTRAGHANK